MSNMETRDTPRTVKSAELRRGFEKTYHGERMLHCNGFVWVEETSFREEAHAALCVTSCRALPFALTGFKPPSFSWGYSGYEPAQLAFALIVDALGDSAIAHTHYYAFRDEVVAKLPLVWSMTETEIRDFVTARGDASPEEMA